MLETPTRMFPWRNFREHLFWRTTANGCFCILLKISIKDVRQSPKYSSAKVLHGHIGPTKHISKTRRPNMHFCLYLWWICCKYTTSKNRTILEETDYSNWIVAGNSVKLSKQQHYYWCFAEKSPAFFKVQLDSWFSYMGFFTWTKFWIDYSPGHS